MKYSTIRALSPAQMRQFDAFLQELSHEELRRRYDSGRMVALEIYAKNSAPRGPRAVEEIEHLLETFDELRAFVTETAATGHGAISYLT